MNIVHNALPLSVANAVAAEFPSPGWEWWHVYQGTNSVKYGSVDRLRFPRACQVGLDFLADSLAQTVSQLWPQGFIDQEWYAGGLHMIPPGGHLSRHLDADRHPIRPWRRVASVVWFANRTWKPEWGGQLIIDKEGVFPVFNSAVLFECNDTSWHEVTEVVGPENRKTLAMFVWQHDESHKSTRRSAKFSECPIEAGPS